MATIEQIENNVLAEIDTLSNPRLRNQLIKTLLWRLHSLAPNRQEFDEILRRMLNRVDDTLDKRVGAIIYDTLAPASAEMNNIDAVIRINRDQSMLLRATGDSLDRKWGDDNSLPRQEATQAIRIALTYNQQDELMDFPLGIRFFEPDTIDPMSYELISTQGGRALLRATVPGTRGNSFFGRVLPTSATNNLARCEIIGTEVPGQDMELDNRYRIRLINHLARPMFGGNIWQYRKWFEELEGVGNTIVYPAWLGGSTSKVVVVDSGYNPVTQEFLDVLQSIFDPMMEPSMVHGLGNGHPEKGLPIGHELTLVTPDEEPLTIDVRVVLRPNIVLGQFENIANDRIFEYIEEVRRDYIYEWEDAILRGDAITLDGTINDNDTNYIIGVHHQIGVFMAKISALLIDTRLIANVTGVAINGFARDYIMQQDKYTHRIPKFERGTLNIILDDGTGTLPPFPSIGPSPGFFDVSGSIQGTYFQK